MTTLPQTTNIRLPRPMGVSPMGANGAVAFPAPHAAAAVGMSAGDVWRIIRSNMWLIIGLLLGSIILGIGAYFVLDRWFPRYTAVGLLQVQPPNAFNPLGTRIAESVYDNTTVQIEQRTQAAVLKDASLHARVLMEPQSDLRKTGWFRQFMVPQRQPDGSEREVPRLDKAKEDLKDYFDAVPIAESRLIRVSMSYRDPKDARTIVENISDFYLNEQLRLMNRRTNERAQMLNLLKVRYENMLRQHRADANAKLAKLNESGSAQTPWGGSALDLELHRIMEQLMPIQADNIQAKSQLQSTVEMIQRGERPPMVDRMVEQDMGVQRMRSTLDDLDIALAGARARGGEGHWQVRQLEGQKQHVLQKLDEKRAEVGAQMESMLVEQLQQAVQTTESSMEAISKQLNRLREAIADAATTRAEYLTLKDEEETYRELLKTVNEQLDTIVNNNQTIVAYQSDWIQKPETPDKKSFPNFWIVMSLAVGLGVALSLGIAFLREMLDTSVRSPRDIARVGQMNLLGMIPDEEDDPHSAGTPLPLVIFQAPHSIMAEQFRQVRTRLQHAASLDTTRSILITSPGPGDGKSTIACNLAAGLALNGRRILLVDANFRRPELHNIYSQSNDVGLGTVLNDLSNFENAVRQTQVPNLDVLTSGPRPANATELLESQALTDFIERALEEYDHVLFDSGPMLFISETGALAPRVDGVVTVVRAKTNSRGLLQRMRDALRQVKAEHLGVVLNGVRSQAGGYYGRNIRDYYEYQNGGVPATTR